MGASRFKVSLCFWHPSIDPEDITRALGLASVSALKVGVPRTTPKGAPLEGVCRESYWYTRLIEGTSPPQELAEELDRIVDDLMVHRSFFDRMRDEGGRSEFS
ncbi:MAG: hypothetical protein KF914_11565 [Rhizobiaceae bacterium]|nr:hypothetical protein [Rhizobiaceae bacterium]